MTDRELLELAAKAAGYNLVWGDVYIVDGQNIDCTDLPYVRSNQKDEADWYWNPLENDGDAMRLLITLCFSVIQYTYSVEIMIGNELIHRELSDGTMTRIELTRLAIVRAAAIQLSKEGK